MFIRHPGRKLTNNQTVTVTKSIYITLPIKRPEVQYRLIYICSAKPRLNKTVLRRRLKDAVVDWWSLMSVGRLFQTRGAAMANALFVTETDCH